MVKQLRRKKDKKLPRKCLVRVKTTFNNTIISVTDEVGNSLIWESAGSCGFKGTRIRTPLAAKLAAESVGARAFANGVRKATVVINRPGKGRQMVIRAIYGCGIRATNCVSI